MTFGLVNIPVSLLSGLRSRKTSLRMLAPDGTPLRRRYVCPRDERLLEPDDIVRGYEIEKDRFVLVDDEELEALEPEKSREIDLRRFVPLDEVDPHFFDRPYFLIPGEGAQKAYLLLADAMEKTRRVGIATFVMRGRSYLVAILAENGILRAETLRFADEVRQPDEIGLSVPDPEDSSSVSDLAKKIEKARQDHFNPDILEDPYAQKLLDLAKAKESAGKGIVEIAEAEAEEEAEGGEVIDLMDILKQRLEGSETGRPSKPERNLEEMTRQDLYDLAKEKNIPGRSRMTRDELVGAVRESGR